MLSILVSDIWRTLNLLGLWRRGGTGFPGPLLVLGGRRGSGHWEEKQEGRGEAAIEDSTTEKDTHPFSLDVPISCSYGQAFHLFYMWVFLLFCRLVCHMASTLHVPHPRSLSLGSLDTVGTR